MIPTFNQGSFLGQCLSSILDQNYPDAEIIVIDGGSSDGTLDVISAYEQHIAFWESKPDRGQSHALNKGFSRATGEILCWQNSDDYYLPNAFWSVAEGVERNPDAAVIYGNWLEVDNEGNTLVEWFAFDFSLSSAKYGGTNAIAQAMFWRRDVHARFGEFPEDLHQVMDHYLTFRMGLNEGFHRFERIDVTLTAFRRHDDQKTGNLNQSLVAQEINRMDEILGMERSGDIRGSTLRLAYRFLRAYRYWRQGGIRYLSNRLRTRPR